jgi:hypothetical protein
MLFVAVHLHLKHWEQGDFPINTIISMDSSRNTDWKTPIKNESKLALLDFNASNTHHGETAPPNPVQPLFI